MLIKVDKNAFGAVPESFSGYESAAIAILPIPYDGTSSWLKGADHGPPALLEASANMELYDIETDSEVFRQGIVTLSPVNCPDDPEKMVAAVKKRAASVIHDEKFIVGIGGEHTVSVGLVQAISEKYPRLSVLQFDAHADTRDTYEGSRFNHACVMSRIGEICPYVQIGIRSMDISENRKLKKNRTFFAHEIMKGSVNLHEITNALTRDVYITIDLDVFDISLMPSTGTPEPGGLDWYTVMNIIERVVKEKNIVGLDITELLPNPKNKAPDFLAAKLIYRILSIVFLKRNK